MIVIGHKLINSPIFYYVKNIDSIKSTPSNSIILIDFHMDLIEYCVNNNLKFALHVKSIKELVFANNFEASYILVEEALAQNAQKIANEYLFDSKILVKIKDEEKIEELALQGIDGVIFPEGIKNS